jgi:hypothetical protein
MNKRIFIKTLGKILTPIIFTPQIINPYWGKIRILKKKSQLEQSIDILREYAQKQGMLEILQKGMDRMAAEVLVKQEINKESISCGKLLESLKEKVENLYNSLTEKRYKTAAEKEKERLNDLLDNL